MPTDAWFNQEAEKTRQRLVTRVESVIRLPRDRVTFLKRLQTHFPALFRLLYNLYGDQYDFFYHLEQILVAAARSYSDRPGDLKTLDAEREANPTWFQSEKMVGAVCYVDLFAGDLAGIRAKIPYFRELGLTYLHLMPLYRAPEGENDGGYAVSSFREVNPALGTMAELAELARALRAAGISLVLDFVFNHTSDEHDWALKALAGDPDYQNYYYLFPDRTLPDQYERTLREIFPEQAPGSFTYRPDTGQWVWTTFHHYQWDLNYGNPQVFNAMMQELLFLANQGAEIIRLDAVAFLWKQMGTSCESLPQVHDIIRAYNAVLRIAAPAMLFKSEAIVHPRDVASYIDPAECQIAYNPTMMALGWEALATREVRLLRLSMQHWFDLPDGCAWVNYVRSHDDIGWTFADEDGWTLGINGFDHRQFLNRFYTGAFEGSFAKGLPFNYNPITHDMRISGTCASLAGVEQALDLQPSRRTALAPTPTIRSGDGGRLQDSDLYLDHALKRVVLLYSLALSAGGIPLIYLGDEIAMMNDYSYQDDPARSNDSRWAHRPHFDARAAEQRHDSQTIAGRVFLGLKRLIDIRKTTPALGRGKTLFFDTHNPQVLGYLRAGGVLCLANFSENAQAIQRETLDRLPFRAELAYDLVTETVLPAADWVRLEPYAFLWLAAR